MDSLTHILMGHAMGTLAGSVSPTVGTAVYWAALIGNSLPDLDVPFSLLTGRGIKLHRTYTHTLPGVAILSAAAALILGRFFPEAGLAALFGWILLGSLVHVAVDCLNLFGARPFWPLNGQPVELGVLHILDPFMLVLMGGPSLGAYLGWNSPGLVAMAFLGVWPYIIFRLTTARKLVQRLQSEGSVRARVVPWYTGWRYIFETEGAVEFGRWHRGERLPLETFVKRTDPRILASMSDPRVHHFLRSAEYPVALVQDNAVVWIDAVRRLRADFRPLRIPLET
ncbi:MAG: metal-dependent hydrolase [Bacillota bacterium]